MGNIKQINIKNRTYHFLNNMINIEDFDSKLLKLDKKSIKILIFMKDFGYVKINRVNPLYLQIKTKKH